MTERRFFVPLLAVFILIASSISSAESVIPAAIHQGGIAMLKIEAAVDVTATFGGDPVGLQRAGDRLVGIVGVDFLTEQKSLPLTVRIGVEPERTYDVAVSPVSWPTQYLTVDDKMVNLSAADLERVDGENAEIGKLWSLHTQPQWSLPFRFPLPMPVKGERFGNRRYFNGELKRPHNGMDYPAAKGDPIRSIAAGTVALSDEHFFAGNSVFVDHGGGLVSMYFHLDKRLVKTGDAVTLDTVIGLAGATGRATGPHLHLGVRLGGARVNPNDLFALE